MVELQLPPPTCYVHPVVQPSETWEDDGLGPHLRPKDSETLGVGFRNLHFSSRGKF